MIGGNVNQVEYFYMKSTDTEQELSEDTIVLHLPNKEKMACVTLFCMPKIKNQLFSTKP